MTPEAVAELASSPDASSQADNEPAKQSEAPQNETTSGRLQAQFPRELKNTYVVSLQCLYVMGGTHMMGMRSDGQACSQLHAP